MRILLLTQHFPPQAGVLAARWDWLSRSLAQAGHQVEVVTPVWRTNVTRAKSPASPSPAHPDGVRVHAVRSVVPGFGLVRRLLNEAAVSVQAVVVSLRIPHVDVVVATVPSLPTLPVGWLVSRVRRVPLVLDLRDAWPELLSDWRTWSDDGSGRIVRGPLVVPIGNALMAALARSYTWFQQQAEAVVVTTDSLLGLARERGLPTVELVRNVVAPDAPDSMPLPATHGGGLRVLYLGNIGRAQLLATAVRAAGIVRDQGADITVRLIGVGAQLDAVRRLSEWLGAPVESLGRVERENVAEHYAWADTVLVLLRDWPAMQQTVPSKLYEALWVGKHISASLAGEAARLVNTTGAGDVVPPQDPEALARLWLDLIEDPARLQVSSTARAWLAEHDDPNVQAARFERLLKDVVGHG